MTVEELIDELRGYRRAARTPRGSTQGQRERHRPRSRSPTRVTLRATATRSSAPACGIQTHRLIERFAPARTKRYGLLGEARDPHQEIAVGPHLVLALFEELHMGAVLKHN